MTSMPASIVADLGITGDQLAGSRVISITKGGRIVVVPTSTGRICTVVYEVAVGYFALSEAGGAMMAVKADVDRVGDGLPYVVAGVIDPTVTDVSVVMKDGSARPATLTPGAFVYEAASGSDIVTDAIALRVTLKSGRDYQHRRVDLSVSVPAIVMVPSEHQLIFGF